MKKQNRFLSIISLILVFCLIFSSFIVTIAETEIQTSDFVLESGVTAYGGVVLTDTEKGVYVDNTCEAVENANLLSHAPTSANAIDLTNNDLHVKLTDIVGRGLLGSDNSTYGTGYWESRYTLLITIGNKTHGYYSSLNYADDSIVIALSQTFPNATGLYKVWWNKTSGNNFADNPTPGNTHIISNGTLENTYLPLYNYGSLDINVKLVEGNYIITLNGFEIKFEDNNYINSQNAYISFQMSAPMNTSYVSKYPKTQTDGGGDAWNSTLNYTPRGSHFVINKFETVKKIAPFVLLDEHSMGLCVGETKLLNVSFYPQETIINDWKSNNTNVATVENGLITAVAPGTTDIVVTGSNGKTDKCTITVVDEKSKSNINTSYLKLENSNKIKLVDTATGVKVNAPSDEYISYITTKHQYSLSQGLYFGVTDIEKNNSDVGDYALAFAIGGNTYGQQWFDKQGYMIFYGKSGSFTIVRTKGAALYETGTDILDKGYELVLKDKIENLDDSLDLYIKENGDDFSIIVNGNHSYTINGATNAFGGREKNYWISVGTMSDFDNSGSNPINKLNYYGDTTANPKCGLSFTITNISPILPTMFSNNMMFQQNKQMNLWGYASFDTSVTAKLYLNESLLETVGAVASVNGKWQLNFNARKGSYDNYTIKINIGNQLEYVIENIVIGELWVSGGQSNMEWELRYDMDYASVINDSNDNIRAFMEPTHPFSSSIPTIGAIDVPNAKWVSARVIDDIGDVSGVAYAFASKLQSELDIPVGIINTSIGGTNIESWMSRESIESDKNLFSLLNAEEANSYYLGDKKKYYSLSDADGKTPGSAFTHFNAKISPLQGMNIAGVIWYQGESDEYSSEIYDLELVALKQCWAKNFAYQNSSEMPFIYSQFAPIDPGIPNSDSLSAFVLGYLNEACSRAYKLMNDGMTSMITLYDLPLEYKWIGEIPINISNRISPVHPRSKQPVGIRFANSALNMVYGNQDESSAPIYKDMYVKNGAIYVSFDNTGKDGLKTTDNSIDIRGFSIAGNDGVYVNANAKVVNSSTVKVWNSYVKNPENVMYAFSDMNQGATLCNSANIPAAPFRSKTFNDNVLQPDLNTTPFVAQDWMTADKDPWVCVDSTEKINADLTVSAAEYDYRPAFTVGGGASEYSYDNDIFTEGLASLKIDYSGSFTLSPNLKYPSIDYLNWKNYKKLTVCVRNTSDISISITANGIMVPIIGDCNLKASTEFKKVVFDISSVEGFSPEIVFNINSNGSGTVNFDNFMFGMTDERIVGDVNNDKLVNILDLVKMKKIIANINVDEFDSADIDDEPISCVDTKDIILLIKIILGIN